MKCSTHNFLSFPALTAMALFISAMCARAQIAPGVVTLAAGNVLAVDTNASTTINGSVNPNGEDSTAWFEWGNSTAYGNSTMPQNIGNGSSMVPINAALTNLTPGFTYHYRCVASNSFGVGRGADQSFWLPAIMLNSPNPMTNECHVPFVDPTTVKGYPIAITAGGYHNLALKADGTVIGWGRNSEGQTNTPASASNVVAIAAGYYHSLALKTNGTVIGWGYNTYGQTTIPVIATNVMAIAAGGNHSLALKADGMVVGWGYNNYGQTNVPVGATNVAAISAGYEHSLALKADGTVVGWGRNTYGQTNTPASATNVVSIATGSQHSLALKVDGMVIGWGDNSDGKINTPANATNVVAISAGGSHSLALKADGTVVGWGNNFYGQANTPANATNVVAIAAGAYHSLALKGDGTIIGWGNYTDGQITVPASLYQLNLPITANGTLDVNSPGTYALSYSITNALGAVATTNRTVIVADTLHPVLTLLGSNPLMHALGTPFLDPGVIATDLCAGDLIASVVTNLTVNPNVAGTYVNTYTVTDLTGHTTQITRTVLVGNPLVTTLPASYMLNNTATLNGTVNPLAVATTAWFEWGTSVAYGTTSAASSLGGGTSTLTMNVALTNLTPGVAYHYRCVASNSFTIMGSGKDQLFWLPILTLKDATPLTNECHVPFVDPGATVSIRPLTIAAGSTHSLALKADGTIVSWGHNDFGQTNTPSSATNVVGIEAGTQHSLALRADGTVIGWGATQYLNYGQSTIPASATNVMAIAAGSLHSLALKTNGTVIGWGNNGYGQTKSPASATNVVGIAAGGFHSLALKSDGSVIGWGDNSSGQTNTPASATNVMAIAAGSSHDLALKADGTIVAWGGNTYGQTNTPAGATNVVAIAAGGGHSLVLRADGTVVAWGNNIYGQTNIPASVTNVVAISAGGSHSLALKADGTIIGWGNNTYGQTNIPVSVYLLNLAITVSGSVDADNPGNYVLTYSATNALGAVATATRTVVILPSPLVNTLPVSGLLSNAATLNGSVIPWQADTISWFEWGSTRAYGNNTAAIGVGGGTNVIAVGSGLNNLTSGLTYHYRCVASNSFGVGRGTDQSFSFWSPSLTLKGLHPVTNECHLPFVDSGATVNIRPLAIAAGYQHSLGLKANGTVIGWGDNTYGQINIPASVTNVEAISAGGSHSLALKADGTVVGWGRNDLGQTTISASVTNVVAVAAGGSHSLALKANGTVLGWGSGQTNTPASATNVTAIAAGGFHSLALKTNGTVVTWGDNTYGQTNTPASATNVIAIAAGNGHSLALKANGTVVGWGWNAYGQTTIPASATNVVAIAGGYLFSLALRADGTVVGWGNNTYGQIFIPVSVTNVAAISAGYEHSLALKADGTVVGWGRNTYGQITIPASLSQLNLPITVSGTVDVNVPGTYLLNYSTTNALGAAATASRTVVVADTLPPVLALLGGNPLMHELGAPFVDTGAIATDLCAGDRTGNIFVWGTVNANAAGSYPLLYIVTDTSGNLAVTDRTVVVVTRPALTGLSRIGNGAFQFTFTNTPGARFNVLASTNVAQPLSEWTVLGPVTENPPGLFQFTDVTATNRPVRYYRLRWP